MRFARSKAAGLILRATSAQQMLTPTDEQDRQALLKVLNFFDSLGTLVRSGAIAERFVWSAHFPAVQMYWLGAKPLVQEWRAETGRSLYLEDVEYLSETLTKYEEKQLARIKEQNTAHPSSSEVRDFLQREAKPPS